MQQNNSKKSETIREIIAEIVKEERLSQNKSQRLIADEYDIQRSLFSRVESSKNEPMLISLWVISEALGMKLSDLIKKVESRLPKGFSLIEK